MGVAKRLGSLGTGRPAEKRRVVVFSGCMDVEVAAGRLVITKLDLPCRQTLTRIVGVQKCDSGRCYPRKLDLPTGPRISQED